MKGDIDHGSFNLVSITEKPPSHSPQIRKKIFYVNDDIILI